jgi:hypothetical protein
MRQDRRKTFRVEWNSPATIRYGNLSRRCILANFSNGGARITGLRGNTVPDEFTLHITRGRGRTRKCRVLWRTDDTIGVEFIGCVEDAEEPADRVPEPAR